MVTERTHVSHAKLSSALRTVLSGLRYLLSIVVVGLFLFPVFWWGRLDQALSAIFDRDRAVFLDFITLANYQTVLGFTGDTLMVLSSCIVALVRLSSPSR